IIGIGGSATHEGGAGVGEGLGGRVRGAQGNDISQGGNGGGKTPRIDYSGPGKGRVFFTSSPPPQWQGWEVGGGLVT
ncbi:hypothetical protein SE11_22650, partial [Salmonella enterica subsp. enterica serovar Braenderup]|uniref:glycerate kinase n=1 Tax=Salmonella enterica TaxID=28901 RepID=UPI000DC5B1BF